MPANQENSIIENPNQLNLVEVAKYNRTIKASPERIWENVKDWEHLPHLHSNNFDYAELDEVDTWGWRIWTDKAHLSHVELCYDETHNQYVARSYQGKRQVSEIWTKVEGDPSIRTDATEIEVRFLLPDIKPEKVEGLGDLFLNLYSTLWDEDEDMMTERQTQLDLQQESTSLEISLGSVVALKESLPRCYRLKKGLYRVYEDDGDLKVHSAICPHNLGPLTADISDNTVTCPWHGYTFNIINGQCISPQETNCKLGKAPNIIYCSEGESDSNINPKHDAEVFLSFL
ncbi:MAG: nitrite reductase/ring-hydroxylating ferredoxin subunit [Flavobacterium sp.]|jgi:nitrite reductase/ring-hydroxylating ferredoxin subunit